MLTKALIILLCIAIPTLFQIPKQTLDTLEIPRIGVLESIYRGYSISLLDRGVVIDPQSLKTNNWVVYGHRFSKRNPLKKYLRDVDKLRVGDLINITMKNKTYTFNVSEKLEVNPSDLWVVAPTKDSTLTLITCTPIMKPINRLIIIGKLVSIK